MSKQSDKYISQRDVRWFLAEFMHDIEEWQSMIEGTPTKEDMDNLDGVYNLAETNIRKRIVWESGAKESV